MDFRMRILVVDDDQVFAEILTGRLNERGFRDVAVAYSADAAIEMVDAQRVPFNCFLLDIMMPGVDGVELCRRLREREQSRSAPIIMITSGEAHKHLSRAFEAGATDFMRKPLDASELEGRIRMAMLLVETTRKGKLRRDALRTLIAATERFNLIDLTERVTFSDVPGMMDYYQVENVLLRMPKGVHPLTVVHVQIRNFRKLFKRTERGRVLQQLHLTATTISRTVPSDRLMLAYLGSGNFVVIVPDNRGTALSLLQQQLSANIQHLLKEEGAVANGQEINVIITTLSDHRIVSHTKALALISAKFKQLVHQSVDGLPEIDQIEDLIFSKLEKAQEKITDEG